MRYQNVCIEAFGYHLPEEIVTTAEIERQLEPLYTRLKLPQGRLELMSGIRERRFWPREMLPSQASVTSAERAIQAAGIERREIGALIHGSVCRDYVEPATAAGVHHHLGLAVDCLVYDVSNACLGLLNGMIQLANMIELGQIKAGIVVGCESARSLVEATIAELNRNVTLTRDQVKLAIASLTIGSASAAVVMTHRDISTTQNRLICASARAETRHHALCRSTHDRSIGGQHDPLMTTDSERLMHEGVRAAVPVFDHFLDKAGWARDEVQKTVCHQVGVAHRRVMFEALGLAPELDFGTLEFLGNTGSVALPVTAAIGVERGHFSEGDRVAMLGIGSGINVLMLGVEWQRTPVLAEAKARRKPAAPYFDKPRQGPPLVHGS